MRSFRLTVLPDDPSARRPRPEAWVCHTNRSAHHASATTNTTPSADDDDWLSTASSQLLALVADSVMWPTLPEGLPSIQGPAAELAAALSGTDDASHLLFL